MMAFWGAPAIVRGRDHGSDMLPTVAVFALLCSCIRRSVYF